MSVEPTIDEVYLKRLERLAEAVDRGTASEAETHDLAFGVRILTRALRATLSQFHALESEARRFR